MKARRRHVPFGESVDPSAFDYTLLSHLYIHDDGNDVLDFGGFADKTESSHEVKALLRNCSFAGASRAANPHAAMAAATLRNVSAGSALLHLREDDSVAAADEQERPGVKPTHGVSRLVRVEDTTQHIWLVTQTSEECPPFARMFNSADSLLDYAKKHEMEIPVRGQKRKAGHQTDFSDRVHGGGTRGAGTGREGEVPPYPMPHSRQEHRALPTTRWIDIQADPNDPDTNATVRQLLSAFPIEEGTIDSCLFLSPQDSVDTTHLSSRAASYAFFMLTCTPLEDLDYATNKVRGHMSVRQRFRDYWYRLHRGGGANTEELVGGVGGCTAAGESASAKNTKGVMEMRFEAVRLNLPRSAVPEPVPVAVVAFADWIITIHEKPFAEMDDLLRVIQLHCSPRSSSGDGRYAVATGPSTAFANRTGVQTATAPQQRFTTAFVFTNLLQISIGHHVDSVALAQAVDELGEIVFDVKQTDKEQDKVLQRITAVRRCFGECGTDVTRRESIIATLLQPNLAHNFLLRDTGTREQFLNAQTHLRYVLHELGDCRDTVAVSNWYHNVALQWLLLRRGNRALRQLLQLTEVANIIYPIITVQTLYSINVPVPFDSDGDPPNESLVPFGVMAALIILYTLLCSRALYRIYKRIPFKTKFLGE